MQLVMLNSAKKSVSTLWQSIVGSQEPDLGYDPTEREPVKRSEISAMFDLNFHTENPHGFSRNEQRDHDNLSTLRDILYPANQA